MLYTITYESGEIFEGGSLEDSKWNNIINPIKELIYFFPNKTLILKNYDSYNHLCFRKFNILTKNTEITSILLIAQHKKTVSYFSYNLRTKTLKQELKEKSDENIKYAGWKDGIYNQTAHYQIINH